LEVTPGSPTYPASLKDIKKTFLLLLC
jgi:hypothetical protein